MEKKWHHKVRGVCNAWCQEWRMYDRVLPAGFLVGILFFLLYLSTISAPLDFPSATFIKVSKDQTLSNVADTLEQKHIIRSAWLFKTIAKVYGAHDHLVAGEYFFSEPITVLTAAQRLAHGDYELTPVRVTLPEGISARQIADILSKKLPDFDAKTFLDKAQPQEGYLFPDTYFFLPGTEPEVVLSVLTDNFDRQMQRPEVAAALTKFGKPLNEVIIMASLLEKEAAKTKDRQMIAGVLWRRIDKGMPLQVDAVFPYIIGKNSFTLTRADLKIDSPYNTYTHKGLPIGPIANPGLDSIMAAMTPIKSNYVYYLSDLNSQFHFSVTYQEHLANQKKYLP